MVTMDLQRLVEDLHNSRVPMEVPAHVYDRKSYPRVSTEIASKSGLKEILYDTDGLRFVFPPGYSMDEKALEGIREGLKSKAGSVQKSWHRKWQNAEGKMPYSYERDVPEGFARARAPDGEGFEVESDVPPNAKGLNYTFWLPIGTCEIKEVPKNWSGGGFPPKVGNHVVNGRVDAYTFKRAEQELTAVRIQREPIVFYTSVGHYTLGSGGEQQLSRAGHSQLTPHNHPKDFSGINDATAGLAQLIIREGLRPSQIRLL